MSKEIKHISGAAGGYLVGNSHKNGGIQAINKAIGKPLEMEGGEVVITKPAVEDNELREFEGEMLTNRQILSRINESGGGVSFAEKGAELPTKIEFCGTEYKYGGETLTDYEIAHRISKCGCSHEEEKYADGGVVNFNPEIESYISKIKNNSTYKKGNIQTNKDGIKYRFDEYKIQNPSNFDVNQFKKLVESNYGALSLSNSYDFTKLKLPNNKLIHIDLPKNKTDKPTFIIYRELIKEESYADGGELKSIISEKFTQGYGKVKYLEISESGGNWKYIHNPNMTVSQRKNAPVFAVESSEEDRKIAQENRINYENNLPTEISILEYAKKIAKSNNGKITHKSNSGSVYIQIENPNKNSDEKYQTIRISDHYILDRDPMNPKSRHDYEIVQKNFYENDSTDLKEIFEEETFKKGGEIKFSKVQKQEVINSQNKFWESNDIYKLSSNGLNVMRKDNSLNPPKYKHYQSFEDFHNEIKQREISKIERENAQKVFDYLETNGAELQHKSVYGSRYYNYKGNPIRVSNHWQTSEIKDSETGLNKYRDIASFYSDKPEGYKEMISKIENLFDKETFANGGNLEKDLKENAVNVAVNATETLPIMEKGGKTSDNEFNYMMLSRLKTDNDYFLGNGNRNPKHLWATNVEDQITEMKRLWNILPVKPEWLSMEDILNYEKQMTDSNKNTNKNISTLISDYKNPYEVNRAIEALLDSKENDFTPNEIEFISHYSGYGGLEKQGSFSDEELKGLLYEYFTPDAVVKKMWALAYKYGFGTFSNPHIMEPSVGTGNFFKYAPTDAELFGNEINNYSKRVCEILYPKAMITLQPFEKNFISKNNSIKNKLNDIHKYHLVIGNPPYGRAVSKYLAMGESDYTKATSFTEYFITRGLDLLHPGGLLIFVVGAEQYNGGTLFLDSGISVVKKNIFDKAQLIDAYRLPTKIFERTGVASEILVFKKK